MFTRLTLFALLTATAAPALADEVNIYSYRQPELLAPLTDAFTAETGIKVNVAHMQQGMVERLSAEGSRSPADLVFTVDIARLGSIVDAELTQPVESATLSANIPAAFHDPDGHWWGPDHAGTHRLRQQGARPGRRTDHLRRPCRSQVERPDLHPFGNAPPITWR